MYALPFLIFAFFVLLSTVNITLPVASFGRSATIVVTSVISTVISIDEAILLTLTEDVAIASS